MGFTKQEYESGTFPGNLPDSGIKPASSVLEGRFITTEPSRKPVKWHITQQCTKKIYKISITALLLMVPKLKKKNSLYSLKVE